MVIELREFEQIWLPQNALSHAQAQRLQREFAAQVEVRWLFDMQQWTLTAQGWVGSIALDGLELRLKPKMPLRNLFRLLEIADNLPIHNLPDIAHSDTIDDFYERLATRLAHLILRRTKQGLYQAYEAKMAQLPYVRGRLEIAKIRAGQLNLPVQFAEISADNPHNQLLLAALHHILRTNLLSHEKRAAVRQAYRQLRNAITLREFTPRERLTYTRLNADYEQMHALCRFFLTHTMPLHEAGSAETLPFLVNMAALFECFVAQWLTRNLPDAYQLRIQERSGLADGKIQIAIDLVIVERATGLVKMVLDTKWKSAEKPANNDIYQITFYANTRHSPQAILIYPTTLTHPLDETIRDVRLRTLVFDVAENIEKAGRLFLDSLLDRDTNNDTMLK